MRVLNVQLMHTHGGNPQVCLDYTRVLKAAGNEVVVLTNPADPFLQNHQEMADMVIPSRRLGEYGSYDILSLLYFKTVLLKVKPDMIIAHDGRSAVLLRKAAPKSIPVIDVNHGRSPKQSRTMDATIVTNKFQEERYKQFFSGIFPIYYVPNSINLEGVKLPIFPKAWHNPPVLGTIGRFVEDKALDVFVDALALLKKRDVDFIAIMAGEGEERNVLEQRIRAHGLEDRVALPGWISKPDMFYQQIDIFCFPSRKEEFGLVLLEAYKNGLPTVVSDAEGPSDIVEVGVDALMVPKDNPRLLADALQDLLDDKAKADKIARAGYNKLVNMYDVPQVARQLQAVLEEVARPARKSAAA